MSIVAVFRDLLLASRIAEAARRAGVPALRVDAPRDLPADPSSVDLVIVDWGDRTAAWGAELSAWCARAPESRRPRIVFVGPHTDMASHAAAREAGLGPMWARSRLVRSLDALVASLRDAQSSGGSSTSARSSPAV